MKRTVPAAVAAAYPDLPFHPTVREVFAPGAGWVPGADVPALAGRYPEVDRRINPDLARRLAHGGFTAVALNVGGNRIADFPLAALRR